MNQKGSASVILVIVIVALAAAVGYFAIANKSSAPVTQSPTPTAAPTPQPTKNPSNAETKLVNLADKYTIRIPDTFTITKDSVAITKIPVYELNSPDGRSISASIHQYKVAEAPIAGDCVISKNLDAGKGTEPVFCEGLTLKDFFTIPGGMYAKYGSMVSDLAFACSMNSECPVKVPAEARYQKSYTFVVPDKSHDAMIEFFVGNATLDHTNTVNGFEGLSAWLHDTIIPSLSHVNPASKPKKLAIEQSVRAAIEKILSQGTLPNPNSHIPIGVQLLSVDIQENSIVLDFSKEIASSGQSVFEDTFQLISNAAGSIVQGTGSKPQYAEIHYTVSIDGTPINKIFPTIH